MKKNYKRNWLFKFKSAFVLASFLLSGTAMAQLSGKYTINKGVAASTTNYTSFRSFASAINSKGVSGPVTVDVVAGSGPYSEQVTFTASGTASNTITINGNGEKITSAGTYRNYTVIYLNGADFFTFDNLAVEANGISSGTRCYTINNSANSNTIKNSNLTMPRYTSTSSYTAYIMYSSDLYYRRDGNHGTGNVVKDNVMSNGISTTAGPYYGVIDYRGFRTQTAGNTVTGNSISDVYMAGVYNYYCNDWEASNNKISFRSRTSYTVYGVYGYRGTGYNSGIKINGNQVENQNVSSGLYGVYTYYCYGNNTNPVEVKNNKISNIRILADRDFNGAYINRSYFVDVTGNKVSNVEVLGARTYRSAYAFNVYYSNDVNLKKNSVDNIKSLGGATWGLRTYRCNKLFIEDNIVNELTTGATSGSVNAGAVFYYTKKGSFVNNVVSNSSGGRIYGLSIEGLSDSITVAHNTIATTSDANNIYTYAFFGGENYDFVNNIAYNTGKPLRAGTNHDIIYSNISTDAYITNGYNDIYTSPNNTYNFRVNRTIYNTFAAYTDKAEDNTSVDHNPRFTNLAGSILTPTNASIANMGTPNYATNDVAGNLRTECGPDLGAYEFFVDHSVSNLSSLPANICGGVEQPISIDVTNGSKFDSVAAPLYYQIGSKVVVENADKMGPSNTVSHSFNQSAVFNTPGVNTIKVGLFCDDDSTNNSLTGTINVISSPTGGSLSQGTTFDGYFESGTELDPDVLAHSYTNDYDISRPTKYSTSIPGADYTYALKVTDQDGIDVTSAGFSYSNLAESFTTSPEDSISGRTLEMALIVSDANTGCDTTITRTMYVPHVPVPSFNSADICLGDVAQFKNTSTLSGSGYMLTNWEFDDPDPAVTDDNSDIKDGFWKYTTYGNDVMVEMTVRNGVYPKFEYVDVDTIVVTPKPLVDFKVLNACEGSPITVKNNTTLPVSSKITYTWDFAGEYSTTDVDPAYTFATPGQRKISVTATANGCFASLTKNAYQFEMPTAGFTSEGECNFVNVDFNNSSTIENGANMGYAWDFAGEGISREQNPAFAFGTPGTKTVTLTATSEFGCVNVFTKDIVLQESPEADFAWDAACNLTPINFTITGSLPNGGANSSYEWDFAGEADAVRADPSHLFSKVGPKIVKLTISDLNGCSSSIVKEVNVVLQAVADFEAGSICEGEEAVFTNKSTVAAGDLTYEWTFGDGASSSDLSPTHLYSESKSFNVKLKAIVEGGCSDEVTYPIVVNPSPDATFQLTKDGRTVVCDGPAGNDLYRWTFGDGSKDDSEDPTYTFENVDQGTFTVCLATKKGECWNDECEDITINLAGIENLTQNDDMINVYPNPTTGKFNVTVENAGEVVVKVGDILGNVLDVNVIDNLNGTYSVDLSVVADGVYFVQVKNGDYFATKRITVSK